MIKRLDVFQMDLSFLFCDCYRFYEDHCYSAKVVKQTCNSAVLHFALTIMHKAVIYLFGYTTSIYPSKVTVNIYIVNQFCEFPL